MKLYARIWLTMIATVVVFALVAGFFVHRHTHHMREQMREQLHEQLREQTKETPSPSFVVRNAAGESIGFATRRFAPQQDAPLVDSGAPEDAKTSKNSKDGKDAKASQETPQDKWPTRLIDVQLNNGESHTIEIPPRPPRGYFPGRAPPWYFSPIGVIAILALLALVMSCSIYPVVRRLTRRVEHLQQGVQQWGEGNLSQRIEIKGHDEIAYLAQRFNQAADQVETLLATHKSLLANASHELRSPLARLRMALALMTNASNNTNNTNAANAANIAEHLTANQQEIERNIAELDELIEEILLASRLDSHKTHWGAPESFDLLGLAAEECAKTGADLSVDEAHQGAFEMQGFPRLIRRLLRNLLENAQRHNRASLGVVRLTLAKKQAQWVITVQDHGAGVPQSEIERVFEPFYRAPNIQNEQNEPHSQERSGVGLGLALVKSIAIKHGGNAICIPNTNQTGGYFVVTLENVLNSPV